MTMLAVGRPTRPEIEITNEAAPESQGHCLVQDEPLIFELGGWDKTGVDLPEAELDASDLGDLLRTAPIGLPGFADIHPLQPQSTVQGALALMDELAHWLKTLTGMPAVALSPKAGAHGELCGLLAIRAAHEARGDARRRVLVPTSAHGTNPATAAFVGYAVEEIAQTAEGRVDLADLAARLGPDVAAIMVTNPNTCGLFERDIVEIARLTHAAGAYFYCDGANFNAIVGRGRPPGPGGGALHINLHKTFSTPHGGGGPGAGPVGLNAAPAPASPPARVDQGGGARPNE